MSNVFKEQFRVVVVSDQMNDAIVSKTWFDENGVRHNPYGPAVERFDPKSRHLVLQEFYEFGELTSPISTGGPARIEYSATNGAEIRREYIHMGVLHRVDGPAVITRCPDSGQVLDSQFYFQGKLRQGGPASKPS